MNEQKSSFEWGKATYIGRRALHEGARWESAVEDYCTRACGGSFDDARAVIKEIRKAVLQG